MPIQPSPIRPGRSERPTIDAGALVCSSTFFSIVILLSVWVKGWNDARSAFAWSRNAHARRTGQAARTWPATLLHRSSEAGSELNHALVRDRLNAVHAAPDMHQGH